MFLEREPTSHDTAIKSSLAARAVEGRASRLHDTGHCPRAALPLAGFAFPAVDTERVLEIAQFPIRLPVVAQRRTARLDRFGQHVPDDRNKPLRARLRQPARLAARVDPRAEKHLADVDVAKPGDQPLIQKRRLDRCTTTRKSGGQIVLVEGVAQGFWPDVAQEPVIFRVCGRHQVHGAEAAGIVEGDARTAFQIQHDMIVFRRCGMVMMEPALLQPRNQHPPGHAKMDQQRFVGRQVDQDVFRPAPQSGHPCPGQPFGHAIRQRKAQIGAIHLRPFDHPPLHCRGKATPDRLDLGKLRHFGPDPFRRIVSAAKASIRRTSWHKRQELMTESDTRTTHFGFKTVEEDQKAGMVHGVFTRVANRYDIMNDVMSAGIHRLWKDAMMDWLAPRPGQKLLDVAGGTGDVSFRFLKRAPGAAATVLDMTESMLVEGRKRAEAESLAEQLSWVAGDAMALPFQDNTFDVYTISFGIRNVTRIQDALSEAYRVLKPGGRLMVLEFSQLPNPALQWAYDRYSFNVIPAMGQIVAGDRDSYQYLVESIRRFPDQETFAGMIRAAGFEQVKYRNLTMGVAALHSGWKI